MFERFGLIDVFSALKRHRIIISIILVLFVLMGILIGFSKIDKADSSSVISNEKKVCIATASYYIDPKVELTDQNLTSYKNVPLQYSNALNADFCQNYVFNKLMQKYTREDLIKNTLLSSETSISSHPQDLNMYCLENIFYANQCKDTMVIQLYVESCDEKLSSEILSCYQSYLLEEYAPKTDIASVIFVDSTSQNLTTENSIIKSLKEADKDPTKEISLLNNSGSLINPTKTMVKWVAIMFILGTLIIAVAVIIIAMFNPTLNRKSDFLEYDIPVIGELYICKS